MGNLIFSVIQDYDSRGKTRSVLAQDGSAPGNNNTGEIVVIPVDGSKSAECAFSWYAQRLHRPENFVYIVHCLDVEQPSGKHFPQYALAPEEWSKKVKEMKTKAERMLSEYQKRLDLHQISGKVYSESGRPGPMIIGVADQFGATMIVMGTRGLGFIRRSIIGSVSSYVIHNSDVPVTIVPRFKPSVFF